MATFQRLSILFVVLCSVILHVNGLPISHLNNRLAKYDSSVMNRLEGNPLKRAEPRPQAPDTGRPLGPLTTGPDPPLDGGQDKPLPRIPADATLRNMGPVKGQSLPLPKQQPPDGDQDKPPTFEDETLQPSKLGTRPSGLPLGKISLRPDKTLELIIASPELDFTKESLAELSQTQLAKIAPVAAFLTDFATRYSKENGDTKQILQLKAKIQLIGEASKRPTKPVPATTT